MTTPVLPGYIEPPTLRREHPLLRVPCRWCNKWHIHGGTGLKPGDRTHRVAHCAPKRIPRTSNYQQPPASQYTILVQEEEFQPGWATPTGRIHSRYQQPPLAESTNE